MMSAQAEGDTDAALAAALISGGDDRLTVDRLTGMNGYGCTPSPRPVEISMSSTTASTISIPAYEAAAAALARLGLQQAGANRRYADAMDSVRARLKRSFDWAEEEVVLSPSGTDSEVLLLYLVRGLLKRPLCSILVSSDETGSGVGLAASGRHFSGTTSSGQGVRKGELTGGPVASIVNIRTRGDDGELLAVETIDRHVLETTASEIRSGRDVVLHVMHHSKTGARGPSKQCLSQVRARHPEGVQIVVDACQGRASRGELRELLDRGYILLVTGSKFFAGPPLSGALVLPAGIAERLRRLQAAPGLGAYATPYDWPADWTLRDQLPERINVGQLLRWTAALTEIERYFAVPLAFRESALSDFEQAMYRSLTRHDCVELLDPVAAEPDGDAAMRDEFRFRSVFSLAVQGPDGQIGEADARALHRALNVDVSGIASDPIASRCCHVGQPVVIKAATKSIGALRISADARLVTECWLAGTPESAADRLRKRCGLVETVFEKTSFLASRFDRLTRVCAERDQKVAQ